MNIWPSVARGVAVGLWTLAGLSYLARVLLPDSSVQGLMSPALLAVATTWTAIAVPFNANEHASRLSRTVRALLILLGGLFALGTSVAMIAEGDLRSYIFIAFVTGIVLALTVRLIRPRSR